MLEGNKIILLMQIAIPNKHFPGYNTINPPLQHSLGKR